MLCPTCGWVKSEVIWPKNGGDNIAFEKPIICEQFMWNWWKLRNLHFWPSFNISVQMHSNFASSENFFLSSPQSAAIWNKKSSLNHNRQGLLHFSKSKWHNEYKISPQVLKLSVMFPISEIESNPSAQCPPWRCYGCGWGGPCTHPPPPRQARTRCTSQGPQCQHPQTWFQEEIAEKNVSFGLNACWKAPPLLPRLHCALSPNALCRNPRLQSACHRRRNSQSV